MSLPKLPNLRNNLLVLLLRTSRVRVEPTHKLCMYKLEDFVLRATTVQLRQDRACFGFILVRVLVNIKIYPYWVMSMK